MSELGIAAAVVVVLLLMLSVRMAQEYQRAVIFRLGRIKGHRGPGLYLLIPLVERQVTVDLRTITQQLDTQETLSSDGVAVKVNAVLWYRAVDPERTGGRGAETGVMPCSRPPKPACGTPSGRANWMVCCATAFR